MGTKTRSIDRYLTKRVHIVQRGNILAWGNIFRRNRDVDGNPIGQEKQNPILDTHQYEVEFTDGAVTEITVNFTDDCIYAQCDKEGNDRLWLDYFVVYRNSWSERYRCKIIN